MSNLHHGVSGLCTLSLYNTLPRAVPPYYVPQLFSLGGFISARITSAPSRILVRQSQVRAVTVDPHPLVDSPPAVGFLDLSFEISLTWLRLRTYMI